MGRLELSHIQPNIDPHTSQRQAYKNSIRWQFSRYYATTSYPVVSILRTHRIYGRRFPGDRQAGEFMDTRVNGLLTITVVNVGHGCSSPFELECWPKSCWITIRFSISGQRRQCGDLNNLRESVTPHVPLSSNGHQDRIYRDILEDMVGYRKHQKQEWSSTCPGHGNAHMA